ncbi:hypothetical protein [Synechococcus sp. A15-127]|jgi:hypothetical protein|uniref:hypothetical protein n=2 Tax=Cyanophyceae TaxID=3028117 RepID=UPI0021080230|nr:hypothetical protein [Synechococcus sp. A15-127]|tara:strand:- start:361 stop:585 length:225 start_codon:yes stop_codon:yes gene_type:complete
MHRHVEPACTCNRLMSLGELFLEAMASGVITKGEVAWVTCHQDDFNRTEEAVAQRLGRLMDEGSIQLGCRLPSA